MSLVRFGISLPRDLSSRFDELIRRKRYGNRSEAIRDLIRHKLIEDEISMNSEVVGVLNILYDHHKRTLQDQMTEIQHQFYDMIISTTHVHLDHHNCMEVILLRGKSRKIREIADRMIAIKGVKHGQLDITSTGKSL